MVSEIFFAAGDSPFFYPEQLRSISWLPMTWDATKGFGASTLPYLWLDYPIRLFIKILNTFGMDWWGIEKILWPVTIGMMHWSMWHLAGMFFHSRIRRIIAVALYSVNTYSLLLFDGCIS